MRDIIDLVGVRNFLRKNRLCTLTTISWDSGYPESSLVYYVIDKNLDIFFLTSPDSRKIKNIAKDKRVALLIGQEIEPYVVQIQGVAEILKSPGNRAQIIDSLVAIANNNPKSLTFPPILTLSKGKGFELVKIKIEILKYSDFSRKQPVIVEKNLRK